MKLAHSSPRAHSPDRRVRLSLQQLEDRFVPGETLAAILLSPMGLCPLQDFVDPAAVATASSYDATVDRAPAGRRVAELVPQDVFYAVSLGAGETVGDGDTDAPTLRRNQWEQPTEVTPECDDPGLGADFLTLSPETPTSRLQPVADTSAPPVNAGNAGTATFPAPVGGASVPDTPSAAAAGDEPPAAIQLAAEGGEGGGAAPMLQAQPQRNPHGGGGGGAPAGYSPVQIRHAYGFDLLANDGAGQTIAIVNAYDHPYVESDLNVFSKQFGLPTTTSGQFTFTKVYAQGSKPQANGGWAQEISLDVEWAHAVAPRANIMLVEAANNSFTNLLGAVDYAASHGASVVSMSWAASDFSGESSYDYHFNAPGVTFLAASGDSGGQVLWPSASPYVVSVGGTRLPLDASGNLAGSETAWTGGGGGASFYESEPTYQLAYGISLGGRGTPDVSYNGDPNTGFAVYDSYSYLGRSGWQVFGGTSAGTPQWAGLVALANQSRVTPLSSSNLVASPFYTAATGPMYASNYRDVTLGSNGYGAGPGYDLATGVGSPRANSLVPYLASL